MADPLLVAVESNDPERVAAALAEGENVNRVDPVGHTHALTHTHSLTR